MLVRSAVLSQVPLTVMGWQPHAARRSGMWYIQSKFLMAVLVARRRKLPPETPIVVVDGSDVMLQGSAAAIASRAEKLLGRAPVVFSAEAYCVPCTERQQHAQERLAAATSMARGFRYQRPPIFKFLNGGAFVTRAATLGALIDAYAFASDDEERGTRAKRGASRSAQQEERCNLSAGISSGLTIAQLYSRRSLYSRQLPCLYHGNDQCPARVETSRPKRTQTHAEPPFRADFGLCTSS